MGSIARIAGKLSRADLGLRAPRSRSLNIHPAKGGCTLHWGGAGSTIRMHADCKRIWRAWQDFHMDTRGWVDIAYTMGFCQHGWVFAGRGYGVRTAGQGTNRGNDISYAFCHINEVGKGPTQAALDAATWLVADARAHGGAGKRVWPHWYWHPTGCPGYELTAHAAYLDKRAIVLPSAMIKNSIQGDDDMPSLQDIQQGLLFYPTLDLDKKTKINVITEISRSYEGVSRLEREMQELRDQVAELARVITDRLPAPSSSSK